MSVLSSSRRARALATVATPARRRSRLALVAAAGLALTGVGAAPAFAADTQSPSQPGTLTSTETGPGTTTLAWGASTDDVGVTEYDIFDGTTPLKTVPGTATQTSLTVNVQGGSHTYAFNVRAKDAAGNLSAPSNTVSRGTCAPLLGPTANTPTNFVASDITDTTATISWTPGTQDWCHAVPTGYVVSANGVKQPTVPTPQTSTVLTGLKPGTSYTISVHALPSPGPSLEQDTPPIVLTTTGTNPTDGTTPTAPGSPTAATGDDGVTVRWGASVDDVGVTEYDIFDAAGGLIQAVGGDKTAVKLFSTAHPDTVAARDAAGNLSPRTAIAATTCPALGPNDVSQPRNVAVTQLAGFDGNDRGGISWDAPAVLDCTYAATKVEIYVGEDGAAPTLRYTGGLSQALPTPDNTGVTITLEAGHSYQVYARGTGESSRSGTVSSLPTPTISIAPSGTAYKVTGSAALKKLVKGALPVSGTANAKVGGTGAFTGNLTLAPTTANLTALGFLPVTATVQFDPTAITGQLTGSALTAQAKLRIRLPSIKTFGIQIAGGVNCQTTQASSVPLVSSAFTPATGGTLAGTFSISNLSNCGALTGVVSPLTAGSGNSLVLKLAAL